MEKIKLVMLNYLCDEIVVDTPTLFAVRVVPESVNVLRDTVLVQVNTDDQPYIACVRVLVKDLTVKLIRPRVGLTKDELDEVLASTT